MDVAHKMEQLEIQETIDWDNLSIGNNSSFFERLHLEHEPVEVQKVIVTALPHPKPEVVIVEENKENLANRANIKPLKSSPNEKTVKPLKKPLSQTSVCEVKPAKTITSILSKSCTSSGPGTPRVYKYAKRYEEKRQRVIQRLENEDKRKREFHSSKPPKFQTIHRGRSKSCSRLAKTTEALTPNVLKHESRVKKTDLPVCSQFKAKPAKILSQKPFEPKRNEARTKMEMKPFVLNVENRLAKRHLFDQQISKQTQERIKKEAEDRRQAEDRDTKLARKMTQFKATPNPFK